MFSISQFASQKKRRGEEGNKGKERASKQEKLHKSFNEFRGVCGGNPE